MGNLIEVEIENKSYIKLIDLEQSLKGRLKLTTLVDNQPRVIIKIFLNKDGSRIPIKEFEVGHIRPEASGIPRFELDGSYDNKRLYLTLKVDGRQIEDSEIRLAPYLRNKFLPLYIIIGIIIVLLLCYGTRWLIGTLSQPITTHQTEFSQSSEITNTTLTPKPEEKTVPDRSDHEDSNGNDNYSANITTETTGKVKTSPIPLAADKISTINSIVYFTPNNTSINKDASLLLKKLVMELQKNTDAVVEISGHCAMSGTEEGRENLSRERAYNTVAYLKQEGWAPETEPVVRWYGGTQPVTVKEDEIFKNRRVKITIKM